MRRNEGLRGIGKYRLAPGFDQFLVDQIKWNRWGLERQTEHVKNFRSFVPATYDTYRKPKKGWDEEYPEI